MWESPVALSRPARADLLVSGQDPELAQWACPMLIPVAAASVPYQSLDSNEEDQLFIDHLLATTCCTDVSDAFSANLAADAQLACLLDPPFLLEHPSYTALTPPQHAIPPAARDPHLFLGAPGAPALPDSLQETTMHAPCSAAASLLHSSRHAPLCHNLHDLSPATSDDLSGQGDPCRGGGRTAPAQREGSTGSERSCSLALPGYYLLPLFATAGPSTRHCHAASAAAESLPLSQPWIAPARPAAAWQLPVELAAAPAKLDLPEVRGPEEQRRRITAARKPAKVQSQQRQPLSPRMQKSRLKQRAYAQRRRVREAAVHKNARERLSRKAALESEVAALLVRHEHLVREQPWHQQHEAVRFMASIASTLPELPVGGRGSGVGVDCCSDMLQKLLLAPSATVNEMLTSAGVGIAHSASLQAGKPAAKPVPAMLDADKSARKAGGSSAFSWRSIVACLALSKAQKEQIAALYKEHQQQSLQLHRDCLAVASKLQMLPGVEGSVTDRVWPNMATHLIGGQLSAIVCRGESLDASLTSSCCQVMSLYQQNYLKAIAPTGPLDVQPLCREVAASLQLLGKLLPKEEPNFGLGQRRAMGPPSPARMLKRCMIPPCPEDPSVVRRRIFPSAEELPDTFRGAGTNAAATITTIDFTCPAATLQ